MQVYPKHLRFYFRKHQFYCEYIHNNIWYRLCVVEHLKKNLYFKIKFP